MNGSIQEAMLALIEASGRWNAFDGPSIARELRTNHAIWRTVVFRGPEESVYMDGESGEVKSAERDFSPHRGLPDFLYGYDTIQVTPNCGMEDRLEKLADRWGADSIRWYDLSVARSALELRDESAYANSGGDPHRVVLELWWD
jgi:hypothetical protein